MLSTKFKYNIGIILLCIGISACNNNAQKGDGVPTVHINPNTKQASCAVSEILSDIEIVRLETNPNSLIGHFSALIYLDNKHIIFRSGKRIVIFDNQGNYLNEINALGKGPGEYATISTAFFDPTEEYIYIVDYHDIKIYNVERSYINKITMPQSPGGIYRKGNGDMVMVYKQRYKTENRDMLSLLDTSYNIFHTFKSRNPDVCKDVQQNLFYVGSPYEIGERLFYAEPFVDTIYEIVDTTLIPHWVIDMGDIGYTTAEGINTVNYDNATDKMPPIQRRETQNYFFFKYRFKKAYYLSLFDKRLNKFIFHQEYKIANFPNQTAPIFGLNNNLIKNAPPFWAQYTKGNIIVNIVSPVSLNDNQLKNFNCSANDNPILFIGILK